MRADKRCRQRLRHAALAGPESAASAHSASWRTSMASEAQTLRSRSHLEAQVETLSRAVPFSERTPRYPRKTASVLMKTSQPWILLRSPRRIGRALEWRQRTRDDPPDAG
jgi:hypothetical protein